jgi:hypothetical protein
MKWMLTLGTGVALVFSLFNMTAQITQGPVEPPAFPEGIMCSPAGVVAHGVVIDKDHPCHCKQMLIPPTSDDSGDTQGAPDPDCCDATEHTHDPQCSQYCHEDHCACPKLCPLADLPQ